MAIKAEMHKFDQTTLLADDRPKIDKMDTLMVVKNNYKYNLLNGDICSVKEIGKADIKTITMPTKDGEISIDLHFRDLREYIIMTDLGFNIDRQYSDCTRSIDVKILENLLYSKIEG